MNPDDPRCRDRSPRTPDRATARRGAADAAPSRRGAPARPRRRATARAVIALDGLNAYYGDDARDQGRRPRLRAQPGDGDDRPVGLRQVDAGALHQPHARGDPRRARRGRDPARRPRHLRRRASTSSPCAARSAWSSRSRTRSRRCRSSTTSPRACGSPGRKASTCSERVERSLRGAGLWDEVKDRLGEPGIGLSGGQQQRLCIARTIAVEPEVILMDEPCSALDPIATLKIEELIDELKQRYTIVIVTHNMQQAARVADTTAFMLDGELVEHAPDREDLHQPRRLPHRGVRHREVRVRRAMPTTRQHFQRGARAARGRGARRPRHRRRAARPRRWRRSSTSDVELARDRHRRRRPHRRPLPRGPPGRSCRCSRCRRRSPATCASSPRCCT